MTLGEALDDPEEALISREVLEHPYEGVFYCLMLNKGKSTHKIPLFSSILSHIPPLSISHVTFCIVFKQSVKFITNRYKGNTILTNA